MFWNIASKSCISVEIESHGELLFWDQGNEFGDTRQIFFHPDGADLQRDAAWARERASNFVELLEFGRMKWRGIEREQLFTLVAEQLIRVLEYVAARARNADLSPRA